MNSPRHISIPLATTSVATGIAIAMKSTVPAALFPNISVAGACEGIDGTTETASSKSPTPQVDQHTDGTADASQHDDVAEVLPAPMSAPDCNLRGLIYLPWFGAVIQDSAFNAIVNDAEFRAATRLWWAAWNQTPAGSLPDDDRQLCMLAGKGDGRSALASWHKIKTGALHGFVKCSDGRLYHPFLCKQAAIAWGTRMAERVKNANEKERKQRERQDRSDMFEQLSDAGVKVMWNISTGGLRELHKQHFGGVAPASF